MDNQLHQWEQKIVLCIEMLTLLLFTINYCSHLTNASRVQEVGRVLLLGCHSGSYSVLTLSTNWIGRGIHETNQCTHEHKTGSPDISLLQFTAWKLLRQNTVLAHPSSFCYKIMVYVCIVCVCPLELPKQLTNLHEILCEIYATRNGPKTCTIIECHFLLVRLGLPD